MRGVLMKRLFRLHPNGFEDVLYSTYYDTRGLGDNGLEEHFTKVLNEKVSLLIEEDELCLLCTDGEKILIQELPIE